ncbi:hypothetical protein [Desulfovibrio sp. JC010]|uniref:hypothetical protein n=1 Tax=Desulfovibrio sp. JC010 TaxID=2593641 RepID=UPI0013D78AD7|nr:hypothetical protein [Desulfovibrio sp. JC010]NDV28466.1 hypothetical protein [Desulfovibrio sp. JC010]
MEKANALSSPLTNTVDPNGQPASKPGTPNATEQDKDGDGVWDSLGDIYDAAGKAAKRGYKATNKAIAKTIDTFRGDEKNAMKYAEYVTDKKRGMCNTMMKNAKETSDRWCKRWSC